MESDILAGDISGALISEGYDRTPIYSWVRDHENEIVNFFANNLLDRVISHNDINYVFKPYPTFTLEDDHSFNLVKTLDGDDKKVFRLVIKVSLKRLYEGRNDKLDQALKSLTDTIQRKFTGKKFEGNEEDLPPILKEAINID